MKKNIEITGTLKMESQKAPIPYRNNVIIVYTVLSV